MIHAEHGDGCSRGRCRWFHVPLQYPVKGRANAVIFLLQTSRMPLYDVVGEFPSAGIALCDAVGEQESVQE